MKAKHKAIDVMFDELLKRKDTKVKPYDLAIHLIVALDDAGMKIVYKKGEKP